MNQQDPPAINLKERFGDVYRVDYGESYGAERGDRGRLEEPWLMILSCDHGHICPWGGDLLAACTNKRGSVAKRLRDLDCTTVVQDGVDGVNTAFHVDHFDAVAAIMKPKRRRRVTPKLRAHLAEVGKTHPFRRQHGVGSPEDQQSRDLGPLDESEAAQAGFRALLAPCRKCGRGRASVESEIVGAVGVKICDRGKPFYLLEAWPGDASASG